MSSKIVQVLGKTMFRTNEGKLIELPSDITAEEAIKLEAEALQAQTKIGKGPAPKPVPDVTKPPVPPKKGKAAEKGKKGSKKKGAGGRKPGGAASAALKSVGSSKVAQYLVAKALPVLGRGFNRLQKLRTNEQTHDDAAEKRAQADAAVVIPPSDGQSKSNAGQVNSVSARPAPVVDPNKGKLVFQAKLQESVPKKVEDVDNFKRDKKAQHVGAEVMEVVQGDKNAVVSTFQDVGQTPPPAPREYEPQNLPPIEPAPGTATMSLGKDAIAPLQKEHTDVSKYTNEADSKLKEEGVTQEQLDMVDSGDLANANKEKKGMEKAAKEQPAAIQKFSQEQTKKVDQDLKQQETKQRSALNAKRKASLGATAQKQKGAKSALEKKREEVAAKINGMYTTAQDSVKKKLADLEVQSMKRFDDGNNKATTKFEADVNKELAAFKADRYSGWFGWARRVKDWWKGMDELPAVKAIFENNRAIFVTTIDGLVAAISADNKRVVQECKDELQAARTKIKEYVDSLEPGLKDIGNKTAEEMNSKLDEMDKFVAKKEEELQNQLKDKQAAAIKAIDEKIEKMKEAMAGALAKLGKLLLWAAKKFFTWALEKFGFSLSEIEGIINKGAAVLKAIFTKPIQFVKNLIGAAKQGFSNFAEHFLDHLKDAVFEWLTGSLEGVKLPQTWDLKGIAGLIFDLVGISYQNLKKFLVKYIPAPVIEGLETTFTLIQTLRREGMMAAWEQLKTMATEMKNAFVTAVSDWIKWTIVKEAIKTAVAAFTPGAGIIRAIIGIYDTVVFFIQKAKDIMKMIGNFLNSISEIAAGNIGAAAAALESGLARGLVLVIDFLARLLRLKGITNAIKKVLDKIRGKVDGVLDKVAKWVAEKAKGLWSAAKDKFGKKAPKEKEAVSKDPKDVGDIVYPEDKFKAGNETHKIWIKRDGDKVTAMISSETATISAFLTSAMNSTAIPPANKRSIPRASKILERMEKTLENIETEKRRGKNVRGKEKLISKLEIELAEILQEVLTNVSLANFNEIYKLEGLVGTYGGSPMQTSDLMTPDHQPQASLLKYVATLPIFNGRIIQQAAAGKQADGGVTINLQHKRHVAGRTYGTKGRGTAATARTTIQTRISNPTWSEGRQREEVIAVLKEELDADVVAMKTVMTRANSDPIWNDINGLTTLSQVQKDTLINNIKKQIREGEDRIQGQRLGRYKET